MKKIILITFFILSLAVSAQTKYEFRLNNMEQYYILTICQNGLVDKQILENRDSFNSEKIIFTEKTVIFPKNFLTEYFNPKCSISPEEIEVSKIERTDRFVVFELYCGLKISLVKKDNKFVKMAISHDNSTYACIVTNYTWWYIYEPLFNLKASFPNIYIKGLK